MDIPKQALVDRAAEMAEPLDLDGLVTAGVIKPKGSWPRSPKARKPQAFVVLKPDRLPASVLARANAVRYETRGSKKSMVIVIRDNSKRWREVLGKTKRHYPELVEAAQRRLAERSKGTKE